METTAPQQHRPGTNLPTMPPPVVVVGCCSNKGLKVAINVTGAFLIIFCCTAIGFMFGYSLIFFMSAYAAIIMIPVNFGIIYVTSRLIFLLAANNFPTEAGVADLHSTLARLVAFTAMSFTGWVISLVWISSYGSDSDLLLFHGCTYGFVLSSVVAGLGGALLSEVSASLPGRSLRPDLEAAMELQPKPLESHGEQDMYHGSYSSRRRL